MMLAVNLGSGICAICRLVVTRLICHHIYFCIEASMYTKAQPRIYPVHRYAATKSVTRARLSSLQSSASPGPGDL